MFEQTFSLIDIPRIFFLAFIEILLSADNAIVLGVISHSLPAPLRKKALFIGLISAFFLRAAAVCTIAFLLGYKWIEILGALYLIYLCVRYFIKRQTPLDLQPPHSFWKTVMIIECTDVVFALDSIIAGLAFINSSFSKLWIVYVGGMIGLISMRFAATLFSSLLDRFPGLERSAYLVVGWVGIKLGAATMQAPIPPLLFWGITVFFFLLGFFQKKR